MTLRRMHEAKSGDRTIQLYGDDAGVPEIFAEGIHGIRFAGTHVKINLYTVAEESPNLEQREMVARLVMPLGSYMDMARTLAGHSQGLQTALTKGADEAGGGEAAKEDDTKKSA